MDLKNQLQEAKKTEEDLVVLLKERIQDSKKNLKNRLFNLEKGLMKNISNQSLRTYQGS